MKVLVVSDLRLEFHDDGGREYLWSPGRARAGLVFVGALS